ncbi:NAD(P)/FAD-dependent oxidoreductase [Magnetovibrio sp.]|uniref:NAD(P)/FAD-dependent oxidoreductase n=1 Tax=Magnetovibrio sp. TaxID=2024836 RepID=UPI002F92F4D7
MNAPLYHADTVIIGTGMAGITLARELRKLNGETTIMLITGDDGAVYSKPMISNAFAQGKSPQDLVQKTAAQVSEDLNAQVWSDTQVIAINRKDKAVIVNTGKGREVIGYGNLVLAVGASPRPYEVEGSTAVPLPAVNNLRDYAQWREGLGEQARVLLIGAGLIGTEFANDLAGAGYSVDVVDPAPQPLSRLLPDDLGQVMQDALSAIGVRFHMGRVVTGVVADEHGNIARLDDGKRVVFDHALTAIGLVANTGLARTAGLSVDRGIRVDGYLRTSDPNIYALGDCAETDAGMLPFILPLMAEARALAGTLSGTPTQVFLPALPVAVKTPALPAVVCPPKPGAVGEWVIEGSGQDRRALFIGADGETLGFALTGLETKARQALAKNMPELLAA